MKIVRKCQLKTQSDRARVTRSVTVAQKFAHPHICQIIGITETCEKVYVFTELAQGWCQCHIPHLLMLTSEGNLFEHLQRHGRLSERSAQTMMGQMISALQVCHENGVVHRDVQLENILVAERDQYKLTSFGHCNEFERADLLRTLNESPHFASPEVVVGTSTTEFDRSKVDVWSLVSDSHPCRRTHPCTCRVSSCMPLFVASYLSSTATSNLCASLS